MTELPPRYSLQLREIAELARQYHARLAASLDLNPSALFAMDWLVRDGSLTPSQIAERLGLSPATTSSVVQRLEQTGHVRRVEHDADGRSVLIVPEPSSVDEARALIDPLVTAMGRRITRYSDEDLALVSEFLDDVAAVYREGIASLSESPDDPGT